MPDGPKALGPLAAFDAAKRADGLILAGADEAGRGPLAGPLVAAAVILDPARDYPGLNDSKKLSSAQREACFELIKGSAVGWAFCVVPPAEVDRLNPLWASMWAMTRAVEDLPLSPGLVLIDGNRLPHDLKMKGEAVVKGDAKSQVIAAASIVAKVVRDNLMMEEHDRYPAYGFDRHKGYGTAGHLKALAELGPCPCHRLTYKGVKPEHMEGQQSFDFG